MNKLKAVWGITNKTQDNMFIPFLDYDTKDFIDFIPNLYSEIKNMQQIFKLGNAFVIKSTNGFNVFFLDKMSFDDCIKILKYSNHVCKNFLKYSIDKHNMTLRLGHDKIFVGCIMSNNIGCFTLSLAHYKFFSMFFHKNIFGEKTGNKKNYCFDKFFEYELVVYMSRKYGYIEVD